MVSFEIFIKAMPPSLSELKVLPSFCFAFKIPDDMAASNNYHIYLNSFRRNYSFLNLEIQRSQYIRPKVTVHKAAETIQGRKLYEEIRYFILTDSHLNIFDVT